MLIFGESEIRFLERMDAAARTQALRRLFARDFPCVMMTMGLDGPPELAAEAERAGVPLAAHGAHDAGGDRPADRAARRPAGAARDAARRADGHPRPGRAHDRRERHRQERVRARSGRAAATGSSPTTRSRSAAAEQAILIGTCPELTRHHVEIRGLGLVNVTDLFGVSATRSSKRVELVVHLERWESGREYDRLGLDVETIEILGVARAAA